MECFLNPWRTRTIFKCVSFGAILLWIVCGSYVRHESGAAVDPGGAMQAGVLGRHLLSTPEELLEGPSKVECEEMVYSKSGKIDLKEDSVSAPEGAIFVLCSVQQ